MKNAIIIHGMPSKEEYESSGGNFCATQHWIPWLEKELTERGFSVNLPEMPSPYDPKYEKWKNTFESFDITPKTILIGHSAGAGFIVRWLSENKVDVGQVVLVAPWSDPTKEYTKDMFEFTIDPDLIYRCEKLTIIYSIDDDEGVIKSVDELKVVFPTAVFDEFLDKGHFTLEDLGTVEFPEILKVLAL